MLLNVYKSARVKHYFQHLTTQADLLSAPKLPVLLFALFLLLSQAILWNSLNLIMRIQWSQTLLLAASIGMPLGASAAPCKVKP